MCRCGVEVKVARLIPGGLGHVEPRKPGDHHPIRLLRLASRGPLSRTPDPGQVDAALGREPNSAPSLEGPPRRTRDEAWSEPGSRTLVPLREHLATQTPSESRTSSATPLPPFATPMGAGRRSTPPGR
jgi:hypothetical protein